MDGEKNEGIEALGRLRKRDMGIYGFQINTNSTSFMNPILVTTPHFPSHFSAHGLKAETWVICLGSSPGSSTYQKHELG